jgi:FHA domain
MALLRRKFTPFVGFEADEPAVDPLAMGSLVERFRTDLSAFSDPVTRTANQLRSLFRKRARKPLMLDLPGKTLVFSSPAEFEFGLASRIEFPVRKAARLVERSAEDLKGMAIKLRAVEKRFAAVFARCLEQPHRIGELLVELESGLLSRDHDWRDIVEALCEHGPEYDDFKNIALVKYMQYLASRQAVLRSIYLEKVQGGLELQAPEPDPQPAGEPMLASVLPVSYRETALFDLDQGGGGGGAGGSDGDDDGTQTLKPVPRGETICIRFIDGHELDIKLASHRYKLFPGKHFCLVDDASGVTHLLRSGRNVIGRHSGNEVVIDPAYLAISRKHIIIEPISENAALLTDISSHGTFITPQYV